MGLRKPPKGGGVELPIVETPAGAADMAEGKQAINDVGTLIEGTLPEVASGETETLSNAGPSHASGNIRMTGTVAEDKILRAGSKVMTMVSGSYFGDATAADVASGKTFTSKEGLNVVGTNQGELSPFQVLSTKAYYTVGTDSRPCVHTIQSADTKLFELIVEGSALPRALFDRTGLAIRTWDNFGKTTTATVDGDTISFVCSGPFSTVDITVNEITW